MSSMSSLPCFLPRWVPSKSHMRGLPTYLHACISLNSLSSVPVYRFRAHTIEFEQEHIHITDQVMLE